MKIEKTKVIFWQQPKSNPEMINFMATHGRGLICAPLTESRCKELGLHVMVSNNTDPMETALLFP
jgi:3,4-dihydroxy 2-butanone 4-phosphate synthase/GTP cyclohydrolase II